MYRDYGELEEQTHNHEFLGSVKLAEQGEDRHNHRFAGVSGEVIRVACGHVHRISTPTDFVDHHHQIRATTGLQIPVGDGKHVHFVADETNVVDGHRHEFVVATLIEAPLV